MSSSGKEEKKEDEVVWPPVTRPKDPKHLWEEYRKHGFTIEEIAYDFSVERGELSDHELSDRELESLAETSLLAAVTKGVGVTTKARLVIRFPVRTSEVKNTEQACAILDALELKYSIVGKGNAVWIHESDYTTNLCSIVHHLNDGTLVARGVAGFGAAKTLGAWLGMVFGFAFGPEKS